MSLRVFHPLGDPPGPWPGTWTAGQRLRLEPDESRYLLRVRRAKVGAQLEVLDGAAAAWRAQLVQVDGTAAVVELLDPRPAVRELPLVLLLVVPEPRATLEALARASETGATAVHLIVGQHSPGPLPSPPRVAKTLRASQRQCGRPCPPQVSRPDTLQTALAEVEQRPGFVASPAPRGRAAVPRVDAQQGACLLVGPEGGLSPPETAMALAAGLQPLSLGPWILPTPTAVAAGLARLSGAAEADPPHAPVDAT